MFHRGHTKIGKAGGTMGKAVLGAMAVGAVLGSVVTLSASPCFLNGKSKRKMIRYKNKVYHTIGNFIDALEH